MLEEQDLARGVRPCSTEDTVPPVRRGRVVAGVLVLWIGWGSVYAAMATTAETIPPLLATGARFVLAGLVLGVVGGLRQGRQVAATVRQWRSAATLGVLCILVGTGGIVVAVQYLASGTVALLAATAPMWVAVVERVWLGRRVSARSVVGLLVGFAGTTLLVTQGGAASVDLGWGVVVVACSGAWGLGMVYASVADQAPDPSRATGMQMVLGGLLVLVLALLVGEGSDLDVGEISRRSLLGWAWMLVMGAMVGYGVCMWLLRVVSPTVVATSSYVNPIVAVFVGWAVLDEPVTGRSLTAGVLVLIGVVVIVARRPDRPTIPER